MKPFMCSSRLLFFRDRLRLRKSLEKSVKNEVKATELSNFHQIKILKKDLWIAHLKNSEVDLPNFRRSKFS